MSRGRERLQVAGGRRQAADASCVSPLENQLTAKPHPGKITLKASTSFGFASPARHLQLAICNLQPATCNLPLCLSG
jgi:hypothetical protein